MLADQACQLGWLKAHQVCVRASCVVYAKLILIEDCTDLPVFHIGWGASQLIGYLYRSARARRRYLLAAGIGVVVEVDLVRVFHRGAVETVLIPIVQIFALLQSSLTVWKFFGAAIGFLELQAALLDDLLTVHGFAGHEYLVLRRASTLRLRAAWMVHFEPLRVTLLGSLQVIHIADFLFGGKQVL